jgi:hypothetical protein
MLAGLLLLVLALQVRPALTVAAGLVIGVAFATTAILPEAYLPPTPCSYYASQFRVAQRLIVWSTAEQIDTDAILWYDPTETLPRGDACAPIPMFPIYNAIQHGSMIRPSETPLPPRLTDVRAGVRASAVRNRSTMVLLSTPDSAGRAAEALSTWSAQRPNPASIRPRARQEATDGDVTVVMQVFEVRRP